MNKWKIYRLLLRLVPNKRQPCSETLNPDIVSILRKYRAVGAAFARFDAQGTQEVQWYGMAGKNRPVTCDTRFRVASVSKHVTALCVMKLAEEKVLDLDMDISEGLPCKVRHPKYPDVPITLRMLLTHTSSIRDGESYISGLRNGGTLEEILKGDSFSDACPGQRWEYSNLGAGIIGCVLEGVTGLNFDTLVKNTVFDPLGVKASFYPQRLGRPLADAIRVFPPSGHPRYDAEERLKRPLPEDGPDPARHWALAHGNLCITAGDLAVVGRALMVPGYLNMKSLDEMRRTHARFGSRAPNLSEGIGTFILQDEDISSHIVYGHQGLAYGAVHGLFYEPDTGRGFVLLTTGVSEARDGVLTDLNADMIRLLIG